MVRDIKTRETSAGFHLSHERAAQVNPATGIYSLERPPFEIQKSHKPKL